MTQKTVVLLLIAVLTACSSKPVKVNYQPVEPSAADWYPLPADAPQFVEMNKTEIPRIQTALEVVSADSDKQPLKAVVLTDSLNATSLQLNRQPGAAWELVEDALLKLDVPVADKNRDAYSFELAKGKGADGAFKLFKKGNGIFVVLVPQGFNTLLVVEGEDDQIADSDQAKALVEKLIAYFEADA